MGTRAAPRFQGRITSWKDDQGFGFITPNGGGPAVFVHIKAFTRRGPRPVGNEIVTYHLAVNDKGQPRAENVAFVRASGSSRAPRRAATGSLFAAGFLVLLGLCVLTGRLPAPVLWFCLGISFVTFIAYARDKSAAQRGSRRTSENTLHLLALLGGWPGAVLAQQTLRHKSRKESFRSAFWATVVFNCAVLGWLLSPWASGIWAIFGGARA